MTAEFVEHERTSTVPLPYGRHRRPTLRIMFLPARRRAEVLDRLEWYYREYGRPPTWDEIVALRRFKDEGRS